MRLGSVSICCRVEQMALPYSVVLLLAVWLATLSAARTLPTGPKAGCSFNLASSSPAYPPHLVDADQTVILPVLVSGVRTINLDVDQQVTVSCVGADNALSLTGQQLNPAVCTATGKLLLLNSTAGELTYAQLGCVKRNREVLIEDGPCANGVGTLIRIGWQFGQDFIPLYDSCHDKNLDLNYYAVNYIVGRSASADDKNHQRPTFSQGDYYPGLSVNTLYSTATQTETVGNILGSMSLANQYINSNSQLFLSRGHLAPDGDFIDWSSQDASYYFMNAAPQWQTFNGGNWNLLENAVRNLAIARNVDLTVYTGTFSVMTLADVNGIQQPIYLAFDDNNNGLIPAPKYYWKLIHHLESNTATAVVGFNDPYNDVRPEDIFCPSVCSQLPWVNWSLTNKVNGYTFCCTAADLYKAVGFSPDLDVPLFV